MHEEFTAARRTLVVRQDIGYSSTGERIDQKRFAAQRCHGVKLAVCAFAHFAESALDCGKLRDVAEMTGHAEILGALKLWRSQQPIKNIQGASLMGYHLCFFDVALDRNHLDRQCADVDAYERHGGSVLRT